MVRRTRKSTTPGPLDWAKLPREVVRTWAVRVAVVALLAGTLTVVVVLAGSQTVRHVDNMARFQTRFADIACNPGPSWIQEAFLEEVRTSAGVPKRFSILQADCLKRLAAGLKLHPWVREVVWIRTEYPNTPR